MQKPVSLVVMVLLITRWSREVDGIDVLSFGSIYVFVLVFFKRCWNVEFGSSEGWECLVRAVDGNAAGLRMLQFSPFGLRVSIS